MTRGFPRRPLEERLVSIWPSSTMLRFGLRPCYAEVRVALRPSGSLDGGP